MSDINIEKKQYGEIFNKEYEVYTKESAIAEAKRCLSCKNKPCMNGCPLSIDIPEFISFVSRGEFYEAYKKIKEKSNMPEICSRVCNKRCQCEKNCVRGIKGNPITIGKLEQFVSYWVRKNKKDEEEFDIKKKN